MYIYKIYKHRQFIKVADRMEVFLSSGMYGPC